MHWELELTYEGNTYVFKWEEHIDKGVSYGFWPNAYIKDGETLVNMRSKSEYSTQERMVRQAASAFRIQELGYFNVTFDIESFNLENKLMELYERATKGEYVGQYNAGTYYVQEAADALRIPFSYALEIVDKLIEKKKVGLSGNIIIPYESYSSNQQHLLESTGHKDIEITDFGNWFCKHCLKSGDEYESPSEIECVKEPND